MSGALPECTKKLLPFCSDHSSNLLWPQCTSDGSLVRSTSSRKSDFGFLLYAVAPAQTCKLTDTTIVFCPKLCTKVLGVLASIFCKEDNWCRVQVTCTTTSPAVLWTPNANNTYFKSAAVLAQKPGAAGLLPSSLTTGRHLSLGTKVISSRSFQLCGIHTLGRLALSVSPALGPQKCVLGSACTILSIHMTSHSMVKIS